MHRALPDDRLATAGRTGLSGREAASRLRQYGENIVIESGRHGLAVLAADTARDPMLWFLVVTALLFFFLGDHLEAAILAAAILPLLGMDAFLHRRTQASSESLHGYIAERSRVRRDGRALMVSTVALVPGDLVLLQAGDSIPADGLFAAGSGLQVDESALTGEAWPVAKAPLPEDFAPDRDRGIDDAHWGKAGTRLLTGEAQLLVAFTGPATLYGEIVRLARLGSHAHTPLQQAISKLVGLLLVAALALCLLLATVRWAQGFGLLDALVSAVTLAIAALPEEFPVVFSFFLGAGIYRMARRQALVRRAVVVESIGRTTVICSDKTGTLTEGRLRQVAALPAQPAEMTEMRLGALAALASRAESGDPLDIAILAASTPSTATRFHSIPFTEDRRRETAFCRDAAGRSFAVTKGAPETIFGMCRADAALDAGHWHRIVAGQAALAHKVIAVAVADLTEDVAGQTVADADLPFRFAGLLAFEDPLRHGVTAAVSAARAAGIRVIMVTGDHPRTALAIGERLGIGTRLVVADSDANWLSEDADIVARAVPAQKLDLVRHLQQKGETVAVTGDGVNDVPALQAADTGIAMGQRGTQSAREIASIVLLDDNFRSIVSAIAEGQQLFRNLRACFAWLIVVHIPFVLTAALVPLLGYPLLYLPVHIVWLELVIHPTAMLAFQLPVQDGADGMADLKGLGPPRREGFFTSGQWLAILGSGALLTALVFGAYVAALATGHDAGYARSISLTLLLTASIASAAILTRFATLSMRMIAVAVTGSTLAIVLMPALAQPLHLAVLHLDDLLLAVGAAVAAGIPVAMIHRSLAKF
jgi:Ca2+-transporting ATPase